MLNLQQLVSRILREERMSATSNPWANDVAYMGTAPSDLTDERNRNFYDAIRAVDRDLRMELHRVQPRMLLERATFSVGPTEKPFPVPYMRYIELVLDSLGRRVPVVSFEAQPELTLARCKALGYPTPLKEAPFRLVVTRPGYWKVSPTTSAQTLTVNFIREHAMTDRVVWADDAVTSDWTPSAAPVVTVTRDTSDWCETLFPPTDTVPTYAASTRFDYPTNPASYLIAYHNHAYDGLPSLLRAGYALEFWVKSSVPSFFGLAQMILSKSLTCATADQAINCVGASPGGEWNKFSAMITADLADIKTIGIKVIGSPVASGSIWLDRMTYTQQYGAQAWSMIPDEYIEDLLLPAVRARLNESVRPEVSAQLMARMDKKLLSFASNDGAGERPRRLRVKVPR